MRLILNTRKKRELLKGLLTLILTGLFAFPLHSQTDSAYIQITTDSRSAALLSTLKNYKVSFSTEFSEKVTFQNANLGPGIELRYKTFGGSLSLPLFSLKASEHGSPTSLGLGFNLFPLAFFIQGEARYMKGFDNLNALVNGGGPVFRQNDEMIYGNMISMFVLNSKQFSLRSALKFINIQKRSAGSLLFVIPVSYQSYRTDNLNLPLPSQPNFTLDLYRSFILGVNLGYAYSKVKGSWCGTLIILGGPEISQVLYRNSSSQNIKRRVQINPHLRITASIIRNKKENFFGIIGQYSTDSESTDGLHYQLQSWWIRGTIGRRFYP